MGFEEFWNEYEKECASFRDDAWTSILLRKISHLSDDDKQFVLDKLLAMVEERRGDWHVALDALEEYGTEKHIQVLIDTQQKPDMRSGFIVKVLAKRNVAKDTVQDYLRQGEIDSSWRFVVKNLSDTHSQLFLAAFDRYFNEGHDIGFDFTTFLRFRKDRLDMLKSHFEQNGAVLNVLNAIN